jgi:hypothetical protein
MENDFLEGALTKAGLLSAPDLGAAPKPAAELPRPGTRRYAPGEGRLAELSFRVKS